MKIWRVKKDEIKINDVKYRFPRNKDASWNSYDRQRERYSVIRHLLGENSVGAEIGVYKGGFGEFLLPHCRLLYLVDPWYRLKPYWGEKMTENSATRALIYILNTYVDEIDAGRVQVIVDFSISFLSSLKKGALDWIYLDASHRYEETIKEIEQAARAVRSGGYILGDDFDPDPASNQHGVYLAVTEWISSRSLKLEVNHSRQWGFKIP